MLPVVAGPESPGSLNGAEDILVVRLVDADADVELRENEVAIAGGLASQMFVWEFATAVAGRLLGINPFDQPDVEAAKWPRAACWTHALSRLRLRSPTVRWKFAARLARLCLHCFRSRAGAP